MIWSVGVARPITRQTINIWQRLDCPRRQAQPRKASTARHTTAHPLPIRPAGRSALRNPKPTIQRTAYACLRPRATYSTDSQSTPPDRWHRRRPSRTGWHTRPGPRSCQPSHQRQGSNRAIALGEDRRVPDANRDRDDWRWRRYSSAPGLGWWCWRWVVGSFDIVSRKNR